MRSILTVPVIVDRFVQKAPSSGADVICLDVEDSVPPAEKKRARTLAAEAIAALSGTPGALFVRVNGPATGLLEDDLTGVVRAGLDGIVVSMTDSADVVLQVDEQLSGLERKHSIPPGSIVIVPLVETARGVVKCLNICEASSRVTAAIFGAEDYATDMGIARTAEGGEITWARNQVAVHCRAAGVVPIDTPDPDYTDEAHLEREMSSARSLGYRGKLCIHPTQVAMANRIFAPTPEEVEEAKTVVDLFEREGLAKGLAAIPADGRMIDTPIYWRAKNLLEWAKSTEA
jgi:citrate lyase subunit beta/citryl-CoA lyase